MNIRINMCVCRGMTVIEIAEKHGMSERTIYRYKAYYDKINEGADGRKE